MLGDTGKESLVIAGGNKFEMAPGKHAVLDGLLT
jgi:hypothetical protein